MILWALAACQPGVPGRLPCVVSAPSGPFVHEVDCDDVLQGTDGRRADFHVGNGAFWSIVRHPTNALTAVGVSGGTLVDGAAWGRQDQVFEVIPLVDDGWMEVTDFELLDDGIRLAGIVRDLPDRPASEPGAPREITWRVDPELPRLTAEGADGLFVHASKDAVLYPDGLFTEDSAYGFSGAVEDLGGAVRTTGTELWIAPGNDPWSGRGAGRVTGQSAVGTRVEVFDASGAIIGRVPIEGGEYDFEWPPQGVELRVTAPGHRPSPSSSPDPGLTLEPSDPGSFQLLFDWPNTPQWVEVRWPGGVKRVPPEGGRVPIGPEPVDVVVRTRPDYAPIHMIAEPGSIHLVPMPMAFDVGPRLWASPTGLTARHRSWRGSNDLALEIAASEGIAWAILSPEDAVAPPLEDTLIPVSSGINVRLGGLDLVSWPHTSRFRSSGWGAPDPRGLTEEEVLARMSESNQLVPLDFLDALGEPVSVRHPPAGVRLERPEPDLSNLEPWFRWLDDERWLPAVGPRMWVDVVDPLRVGRADMEQALHRGNTVATTGPLLVLDVNGTPPGELAPPADSHLITVDWRFTEPPDVLVVVDLSGRELLRQETPATPLQFVSDVPVSGWIAVAWNEDDWAVTNAVLTLPPS